MDRCAHTPRADTLHTASNAGLAASSPTLFRRLRGRADGVRHARGWQMWRGTRGRRRDPSTSGRSGERRLTERGGLIGYVGGRLARRPYSRTSRSRARGCSTHPFPPHLRHSPQARWLPGRRPQRPATMREPRALRPSPKVRTPPSRWRRRYESVGMTCSNRAVMNARRLGYCDYRATESIRCGTSSRCDNSETCSAVSAP